MRRQIENNNTVITMFNIPITLNNEDRKQYNEYNEYITKTLDLYNVNDDFLKQLTGNITTIFELITCCSTGKKIYNGVYYEYISADYYANALAENRGWNKDNDLSIEYYNSVDKHYNPELIKETAKLFYEIIRLRRTLVVTLIDKLYLVKEIISSFPEYKTLTFSKDMNFVDTLTENINNLDFKPISASIHSKLYTKPYILPNGELKLYKSGNKKGTPMIIGKDRQIGNSVDAFNDGSLRVLNISSTLHKKIQVKDIQLIIITSPLVPKIKTLILKNRLASIKLKAPTYIVNLYVGSSIESDRLVYKQSSSNNRIIDVESVTKMKELIESRPQ